MSKKLGIVLAAVLVVVGLAAIGYAAYVWQQHYAVPRCEACGMMLEPAMKKYKLVDEAGNEHIACCPGCLFRLLAKYPTARIETYCDWYGPSKKIVVEVKNGEVVKVEPESARLILGAKITKSCASNRIAYDETAVENLRKYGYNHDHPEYCPFKTEVPEGAPALPIREAAKMLPAQIGITYAPPSTAFLACVGVVGVIVLILAIVAYAKLKPKAAAS